MQRKCAINDADCKQRTELHLTQGISAQDKVTSLLACAGAVQGMRVQRTTVLNELFSRQTTSSEQ